LMALRSTMSDPMPVYLLDKNVVRRAIAGMVKVQVGERLTQEEDDALALSAVHQQLSGTD